MRTLMFVAVFCLGFVLISFAIAKLTSPLDQDETPLTVIFPVNNSEKTDISLKPVKSESIEIKDLHYKKKGCN